MLRKLRKKLRKSSRSRANMSHVDVKNLKPTTFEEENYDQYEFYNLSDKYTGERTVLLVRTGPTRSDSACVPVCACVRVRAQRARPGKAEPRRRRATTPTGTTRPDTSARSATSCSGARRRRSEPEVTWRGAAGPQGPPGCVTCWRVSAQ